MEILSYPFMQRALIAALLTGLIAPTIGIYIVQKRLSLLGDGLGHVAIAGVGLALLTGTAPLPVAVLVTLAGAVLIEYLRQNGRASGDVGLAILFYGGLAGGVFMSGLAGAGGLNQYLFGSITTISTGDLVMIAALTVVALLISLGLADRLFAVATDEEYARTLGIRVAFYNYLTVVLAAVAISLAMRTVGLLLVSALMVIPVAASRNLVAGFWWSLLLAMAIGLLSAGGGIVGSFYWDAPPGALIVLIAIGAFALSLPAEVLLARRRRLALAAAGTGPLDRPVVHGGPECRHRPIPHGDHVDFVEDDGRVDVLHQDLTGDDPRRRNP